MRTPLRDALRETLNRASAENGSNTPDFILAAYLSACLGAFDNAVKAREAWYGREATNRLSGKIDIGTKQTEGPQ